MEEPPQRRPVRLVITGAPGSGKTQFFERLRQEPEFADFTMFGELARTLLDQHPEYRQDWAAFHREVYRRQVQQEGSAGDRPFITDRGTADAFAFHPETAQDVGTTIDAEYTRYTGVVHLGTAAVLGDTYYRQDPVRCESQEEALAIEERIRRVWKDHPGYAFVEAMADIERKYQLFLETMRLMARRT